MRKTKIVCTLGPASESEDVIRQLMLEGMDVARFNFSHGSHQEHLEKYKLICRLRDELHLPVATMLDTKGPEIRLGTFKEGKVLLHDGDAFTLTTKNIEGSAEQASVSFEGLPQDVQPGTRILVDDGLIELSVQSVNNTDILCKVIHGGWVSNRKGVNLPDVRLSMPYLSANDHADLKFAAEQGFDWVAASFARTADDIIQLRQFLQSVGGGDIKIIAKIENAEGVSNIDRIVEVADGVMVARGDMGVEIPFEDLPSIQKHLIKRTVAAGKPVITATQMLESMIKNPRPTRAEISDVANAIYDGTSAIMLSGETAAGQYPIDSVRTMSRIAERTEKDIDYYHQFKKVDRAIDRNITNAISHATCTTAYDLNAAVIIAVSHSGATARMVSRFRPQMPIIGSTSEIKSYRQLNLCWGVFPVLCDIQNDPEVLVHHAIQRTRSAGLIKNGDTVVITGGVPMGVSGTTSLLRVCIVDEPVNNPDV